MNAKKPSTYSGAALRLAREERERAAADPAVAVRRSLESHERAIENGLRSFVVIGQALLAIRAERLYSGEYSTFAEYLLARWDLSESYVSRLIGAAHVATKALPIGMEINSEAVARELTDLAEQPEMLRQIWDEATRRVAGGRITAALVKEVRRGLEPPKRPALEGEVIDPVSNFPEVEKALEEFHTSQAAGLVDSPIDESGEDHPAPPLGDAADTSSGADELGVETGTASSSEENGPVDGTERAETGVWPPAPVPAKPGETDEERAEREQLEFCTDRTREFSQGLVDVTMRLADDPIRWFENVYLKGVYANRDLPRVSDCFEPDSLVRLARNLDTLADYLKRTGQSL